MVAFAVMGSFGCMWVALLYMVVALAVMTVAEALDIIFIPEKEEKRCFSI